MNIKNYTSAVPVEKTISRIEMILAKSGVNRITKEYGPTGEVCALHFMVTQHTKELNIRVPARIDEIKRIMRQSIKRPRRGTTDRVEEQAYRTAWKVVQDWVEVQMTLIKLGQVEFTEAFLAYVWDGKQTFYSALKERGFKGLLTEKASQ